MQAETRLSFTPTPSLVVVCGPSSLGKTLVVDALIKRLPTFFRRPLSYTTRPRRSNESEGEYRFVTQGEISQLRAAGNLLNFDEAYGHYYAMDRRSIDRLLAEGVSPVKEVHPSNLMPLVSSTIPITTVLLLPQDWQRYRERAIRVRSDRLEKDEADYRNIDCDAFDIVQLVPHDGDVATIAASLARSARAMSGFRLHFPPPGRIDAANRGGYNVIAADFTAAHRPTTNDFHTLTQPFFRRYLDSIPSSSHCLELGPGRGWLWSVAQLSGVRYASLDLAAKMTELSERVGDQRVGSARSMPWDSAEFDVVVASLADPFLFPTALAEIRRVLRKGGQFAFSVPSSQWSHAVRRDALRQRTAFVASDGQEAEVFSFTFAQEELTLLLESTGFAVVENTAVTGAELGDEPAPAIRAAATVLSIDPSEMTILYTVVAEAIGD